MHSGMNSEINGPASGGKGNRTTVGFVEFFFGPCADKKYSGIVSLENGVRLKFLYSPQSPLLQEFSKY
jgi:hypothetical protein